ncbi:hypothetical protein Rsub_01477 [Raphidocelis subcapitata]|uniref:Uncharacterized protein n=1 Tax=Raphidocelis subcapitata TaxID=307507 RepID=A0A2V0NN46_9CHLO|nr:hypothetical protein Rsub_01477 [Raphidocelis subcapitata]|eukprot:GBF88978.1 hypothetical protein Rsub_01477 [Raphidocelis subcapitata]
MKGAPALSLYVEREEPRDVGRSGARRVEDALREALRVLESALRSDPNLALEAKTWLIDTIASLRGVEPATAAACFLGAPGGGAAGGRPTPLSRAAERQLLALACDVRAPRVAALLAPSASLLRGLFSRSDALIAAWFGGFGTGGLASFRRGAWALAGFSLARRDDAWRHLVWAGRHPQAPVAVAAKPHYFSELDVVATVRNLLRDCPEFWESHEVRRSLEGGEWLALDPAYIAEELQERLHRGGAWREDILRELSALPTCVGWRALCQRVAPLMGEGELLAVLRTLGARHFAPAGGLRGWARGGGGGGEGGAAVGAGGAGPERDAPLALAGVEWRDARDALLANALACHAGRLRRVLAGDAAARPQLQRVAALAAALHGGGGGGGEGGSDADGGAAQRAFLRRVDPASPRQRLLLLLNAWTLRLHLVDRCAGEGAAACLAPLLTRLGWQWQRQGDGGGGGDGGRPRPSPSQRDGGGDGEAERSARSLGLGAEAARLPHRRRDEAAAPAMPPSPALEQQQQQQQEEEEEEEEGRSPKREQQRERREPLSRGEAPGGASKRRRSRSNSSGHRSRGRSRSSSRGSSRSRSRSKARDGSRSSSSSGKHKRRRSSRKEKKAKRKKGKRRHRRSPSLMSIGGTSSDDAGGRGSDGRAGEARAGGGGSFAATAPGGARTEGGPDEIVDAAVQWACREWVRALV